MWKNVESWLVYANKLSWIAQPGYSTDIIKPIYCQLLFLLLRLLIKKITFCIKCYFLTVLISIHFNDNNNKKKLNCFTYIALAKHRWLIKLGEFKIDQKYFAS